MLVGIWKMEMRAGLPSSPSTTLRRRRLSATFCSLAAFFSRRLASLISSDTVSRTASRRAVIAFASVSRRTSSGTGVAAAGAAEASATGATTAAAAGEAEAGATAAGAAFFVAFTGLAASATGAGEAAAATAGTATASSAFFVTRLAAVFTGAAELIIPEAEVEVEDILRRTSYLQALSDHFYPNYRPVRMLIYQVRSFLF